VATCILCRHSSKDIAPDGLCQECDLVHLETDLIYHMYESNAVEDWAREFVRELEAVFRRDRRAARFFEAANEVILVSLRGRFAGGVPIRELRTLRHRTSGDVSQIMAILETAKIAAVVGDRIVLGDLGKTFADLVPAGVPLTDESVRAPAEEMRGAICVALSKALIGAYEAGDDVGRPRNYVLLMKRLGRHVIREVDLPGPINATVPDDDFFECDPRQVVQVSIQQRERLLADLVGLGGGAPRIVASLRQRTGGHFEITLKDSVVAFLERVRERERERRRERARG